MTALKSHIQDDMKTAMRAKDAERLGTIRLLLAAIKQKEVDGRITLDDAGILSVINTMLKQRRDAATQFRDGNRLDLAEKEEKEITHLTVYLPQQLSDAEISALVEAAIAETGATLQKEMGKVMGIIRPKAQGRADMAVVSQKIKEKLQ